MSMRHSVASGPGDASRTAFADDVAHSLTQSPRQLPSRYLYDELGSSLFEAICRLPWYRVAKTEQALLRAHAAAIFSRLPPISTVVELGPGSGEKLVTLMAAGPERDVTVHLVDVSRAALDTGGERAGRAVVAGRWSRIRRRTRQGCRPIGRSGGAAGQTLVVFLGSNIGNFDPPGTDALLRGVRAALGHGDALLLGTDLVKPEPELLLAYDDPLGVTAAFNRNLLVRVNRELDGDFDVNGVLAPRGLERAGVAGRDAPGQPVATAGAGARRPGLTSRSTPASRSGPRVPTSTASTISRRCSIAPASG